MNFTVILESLSNTETLYMGSGVLISNRDHIWVISAGHCVGTLETGKIKKMGDIRVRCPLLPNYNNDPVPHARDKKDDHRLQNYMISMKSIFIYPLYFDDENCRGGTDIGMLYPHLIHKALRSR